MILVSGEAGIGKSRLVLALRDHLGPAVPWLSCAGSPYTQSSPLRPLVDLLRQALAERPGDSALDRLASLLQDQGHAEDLPFLAALLDLPLDGGHALPVLSPERQRARTLEALTTWVLDTAERQPLVLLIEDLHWLDPTTLDWLDRLVAQVPTVPLFLLLTLRLPALEPLWRPHSHVAQITLSPLTEREARTLITHLAGERSLPAAVRQQIIARTDGVPLFLEELTRVVIESNEAGESLEFPDTLRDLLARGWSVSAARRRSPSSRPSSAGSSPSTSWRPPPRKTRRRSSATSGDSCRRTSSIAKGWERASATCSNMR